MSATLKFVVALFIMLACCFTPVAEQEALGLLETVVKKCEFDSLTGYISDRLIKLIMF